MSDIIAARNIETITTEIKTIETQMAKTAIYGCIEIGKRLVEAKEMVGHGNWGKYLEEKVRYSQQWATNLMNLYREYGGAQESLFDNFANSKSFGKIDVTKHILLLGVPAEDREAFAAEHDAENATTRELQAAIRERDEANTKVADLKKKLADTADQLDIAGDKLLAKDEKIRRLQDQAAEAGKIQSAANEKVDKLKQQLAKAKDAEKAAKAELEKAKASPEVPESMMEAMRQQVAADAAAKATADLQKKLTEAQEQADKAVKERKAAEEKVAEAQKAVQLANPDAAVFKMLFKQVQEDFNKLHESLQAVQKNDPDTGQKLKAAMVTLLDKLRKDMEE